MQYKIKTNHEFVVISQDLNNLTIEHKDIPGLISELEILYKGYAEVEIKKTVEHIEHSEQWSGGI